uniref:helix-turn-helix domain-containing protein n=1 Tax=Altererythrobacter segetis TaxID=1104773 RepID=UPI00140C12B7|nr:helix-turn-helix domain-containing protein [Altererythrobacter segetis]
MENDDAIIESPPGVGEQLRAAREAKDLTLEQVAAETRIPQRHLMAMEEGDFAKLPGRTYAVGFARTYAKTVGLDPDAIGVGVRAELDAQSEDGYRPASFEPGDPARVPSRALGWFAGFAVLLLLAGGFFFFRTIFAPAGELPSLVEQQRAQQQTPQRAAAPGALPAAPTAANPTGPVVFTALAPGIWVKFYDANGKQLMQKQMVQGESFTVPADAQGPMLWTGRPDALAITVGGKPLPKLAEQEQVMKDVPVTAQALLARGQPSSVPAGEKHAPAAT